MERSRIDLHMHSTKSDGTDSPALLLKHVKEAGIHSFALTDHDATDGALEVERLIGGSKDKEEPEFFRGIEFSCETDDGERNECHLLGFGYDPEDPVFFAAANAAHRMRMEKTENRLKSLKEHGITFTDEEVEGLRRMTSPGRPQIAELMLRHGFPGDRNQACEYIGQIEKKMRMPSGEVIAAVLHSGGVPVYAHPLGETVRDRIPCEECDRRIRLLQGEGIMGLECWYSEYSREDVDFLLSEARKYHLLVSGGSDYHGSRKTVRLGQLNSFGEAVGEGQLTVLERLRAMREKSRDGKFLSSSPLSAGLFSRG